jgi:hypothetical protein
MNLRQQSNCPGWSRCMLILAGFLVGSGMSLAAPKPHISNISPSSATAGGPAFTLVVNGSNFVLVLIPSQVLWNGVPRPTLFVSSNQLRASIPATDIAIAGTAEVTVRNRDLFDSDDDETSNKASFSIVNPVPSISSLSPASTGAGGPNFTLTVNGSNFVAGSVVRFRSSNRNTTFVSGSQLTALIQASDISQPGTADVSVVNPSPGGGPSQPVTFTITAALTITTPSPLPAGTVGSAYSQTLAASGGAAPYSWSVTAGSLPAGLALAGSTGVLSGTPSAPGNSSFTIRVSDSGAGTATKQFTLAIAAVVPALTSINPTSASSGGPAFTLTVNGSNFVNDSTVRWNASGRPTTFVSGTQLTASIPASDIATAGTANVTVANPGNSLSNSLPFTVSPPPTLTITTSSPLPGGTVGSDYSQTFAVSGGTPSYSWSVISGSVPAGLTLNPSTGVLSGTPSAPGSSNFTIRVSDSSQPTPGTTTKPFSLTIATLVPVLTSINPSSAGVGGSGFTLTVNGSSFVDSSTVRWNGSNRTTSFVSGTQLTASIPASDIATAGTANVTVVNFGSSSSNSLPFTISPAPTLTITTPSPLPAGTVGSAYSQTLTVTGGTPPYNWSVISGSLPAGLTLNSSTGVLSGTPSVPGNSEFTIRVSDSSQPTAGTTTSAFTLAVAVLAPVLTSLSPSSANAGGLGFTLTVDGSNFESNSVVRWNNLNRTTTFVSRTRLTASISASDIATPGTANVTVSNSGETLSNALGFTISTMTTLTLTTASPLLKGIVGYAYSQALAASGGSPPYTWSVTSGSLPSGLTLDASTGTIGGTPSLTGNSTFTVQVRDSSLFAVAKDFQISINPAPAGLIISGVSDSVDSAQQPTIEITSSSPYSSPISGQLTVRFNSNADVPSDDPAIQFSTGGRTVNFQIPANSTRAIFSNNATNVAFQTGTVAGTINLSVVAQTEGITITPPATPERTLTLNRTAPAISRLNIASRSASGFQLVITGFSNSRSLRQVTFRFTPTQTGTLQTSIVTLDLSSAATNWFESQTGRPFGGQFQIVMPFTVQGDLNSIQSVSVTLTNAMGESRAANAQF